MKLTCANCGKKIERTPSDVRYRRKKGSVNSYCDKGCYDEHRRKKRGVRTRKAKRLRGWGFTLEEIGEELGGITKQRVWGILSRRDSEEKEAG